MEDLRTLGMALVVLGGPLMVRTTLVFVVLVAGMTHKNSEEVRTWVRQKSNDQLLLLVTLKVI